MFRSRPRDFSESEETSWMREDKPGEFYQLYCKFMADTHHAMIEISSDPDSLRDSLGEEPSLITKRHFYKRIASMTNEVRRGFLRDIVAGHKLIVKETEARASEFLDTQPLEGLPPEQIGKHLAKMMLHCMSRKSNDSE